jgi:hypothetical protein
MVVSSIWNRALSTTLCAGSIATRGCDSVAKSLVNEGPDFQGSCARHVQRASEAQESVNRFGISQSTDLRARSFELVCVGLRLVFEWVVSAAENERVREINKIGSVPRRSRRESSNWLPLLQLLPNNVIQ